MDRTELIEHAKKIAKRISQSEDQDKNAAGAVAETSEFLRVYAGPKSMFYEKARNAIGSRTFHQLLAIMESFISYVEAGLHAEVTPERKAQMDVVSDFLEQAQRFLDDKKVHPAVPTVLIGATLEEFLRTWFDAEGLSLAQRKPGLDNYAQILRENEFITKQDYKDITSWAGLRNHAAHGEWEEVSDRRRIELMMESVNLFMRKYSK